jgi:Ion channel
VLLPPVVWALPWLVFALAGHAQQTPLAHHHTHLAHYRIITTVFIGGDLTVLFGVLLRKRTNKLPRPLLFAGFVSTVAALAGSYSYVDLVTSRALPGCYTEAGVQALVLSRMDAVYYSMSTLTTAGFGDITAHTAACRSLTAIELGVGLCVLGLAVAAVAARLFEN